jgi:hypothetical protein
MREKDLKDLKNRRTNEHASEYRNEVYAPFSLFRVWSW